MRSPPAVSARPPGSANEKRVACEGNVRDVPPPATVMMVVPRTRRTLPPERLAIKRLPSLLTATSLGQTERFEKLRLGLQQSKIGLIHNNFLRSSGSKRDNE